MQQHQDDGINVLSLFDGMSCGQIALERAGIKVKNYFASEIDKHAIAVTMKNYPNTIQLGSVVDVKGSDLPEINLLIGGSPCFVSDTLILTDCGYKEIKDIVIGDSVLTHSGNFRKVLSVGNTTAKTRIVKMQGSLPVETTDEHPFYVKENKDSTFEWKAASELKVNKDFLTMVKDIESENKSSFLYLMGEDKNINYKDSYFYNIFDKNKKYITKNKSTALLIQKLVIDCFHQYAEISITDDHLYEILLNDSESNCSELYATSVCTLNEETNTIKTVYNLEVEIDNSYTANNIVVHNCQGFSFCGKELNFNDPRSKLYFEYVRLLKECKPKYFLLENVLMRKEYEDVITRDLQVAPIKINSRLITAQNRPRIYWTNIPNIGELKDKGIKLIDILENLEFPNPYEYFSFMVNRPLNYKREKFRCLLAHGGSKTKGVGICNDEGFWRKLTPTECEELQTVPRNYTDCVSDAQRYVMLGNGWTVDVIAFIFKGMLNENIFDLMF